LVPQAKVQPKGVVLRVPEPQVPPGAPELLLEAPLLLELVGWEPELLELLGWAPELLELLGWEPELLELVGWEPELLELVGWEPLLLELVGWEPLLLELLGWEPLLLVEPAAPELLPPGRRLASTGAWRSCPHAAPRTIAPSARSRGADRFMGQSLRASAIGGITERRRGIEPRL
jgi:hypothetical protein